MADQEHFAFVQALARDLDTGNVRLPSLPAVVIKIRELLEDDDSDFEQVGTIVSADAALASRLFVVANSAYHNRTGEKIVNLEAAIAKLGLDLVRNTAVALVVKQLVRAQEQSHIAQYVSRVWSASMRLSAMSHAVAGQSEDLNDETAFMCGLLHYVGKLYILSKARDVPGLLSQQGAFSDVLENWYSQTGRCIVEAWGFPDDVVESMDPDEFLDDHRHRAPRLVDVVHIAELLMNGHGESLPEILAHPSGQKLKLGKDCIPGVFTAYTEKLDAVQHSLA